MTLFKWIIPTYSQIRSPSEVLGISTSPYIFPGAQFNSYKRNVYKIQVKYPLLNWWCHKTLLILWWKLSMYDSGGRMHILFFIWFPTWEICLLTNRLLNTYFFGLLHIFSTWNFCIWQLAFWVSLHLTNFPPKLQETHPLADQIMGLSSDSLFFLLSALLYLSDYFSTCSSSYRILINKFIHE